MTRLMAPILARRFGSERVILGILLTLALGILAVVIAAVWWRRHRRAALPPEA